MSIATCFVRERMFFLGLGRGGEGGSLVKVSTKKGSVILLCKLFKGRITHLFQNLLMRFL